MSYHKARVIDLLRRENRLLPTDYITEHAIKPFCKGTKLRAITWMVLLKLEARGEVRRCGKRNGVRYWSYVEPKSRAAVLAARARPG